MWSRLDARHAWRGAFAASVLNAAGMDIDFYLARGIPNKPWYPWAISAIVGFGLAVVLLIRRKQATVRLGSAAFLINMIAIQSSLWITSGYWATTQSWTPFQANKLGALTVPLLAPKLWVGLAAIIGFAATAIVKFYRLDPAIERRLPLGEPWLVLVFAIFGAVLLVYRLRSISLEREAFRLHAESAAAEEVARTFLQLRDYTNTPVQTILLAAGLLRQNRPDLEPIVDRLERAASRLIQLSGVLTKYDALHKWNPGDESLDAAILPELRARDARGKA